MSLKLWEGGGAGLCENELCLTATGFISDLYMGLCTTGIMHCMSAATKSIKCLTKYFVLPMYAKLFSLLV